MDIKKEKREIRKKVLARRDALGSAEREAASLLLTERILGHPWFYRSEYFLCFASFGSEISTWELLSEALRAGRKVYVPKVAQGAEVPQMRFYRIASLKELSEGYRGIPEPAGDGEEYPYSEALAERTLMLMPGVAFDRHRRRLGYGKGFYDRYLACRPALWQRTIAAGYLCQLVDELPAEETDIRPCQVICM